MDVRVGDILHMKKPHPCGSKQFVVLRIGMDFRLKCQGCGHVVVLERPVLNARIKKVLDGGE